MIPNEHGAIEIFVAAINLRHTIFHLHMVIEGKWHAFPVKDIGYLNRKYIYFTYPMKISAKSSSRKSRKMYMYLFP
jgi:hypothetical protein